MHKKLTKLATMLTLALLLAACGSDGADVPTLQDTQPATNEESVTDPIESNEALMMTFTECLREQGLNVADPVVGADGNIGKPELVGGGEFDKEVLGEAMEACREHLEGLTFEEKRIDVSELVDQSMALAACLRDKGYDVPDPTAETLVQWRNNFKDAIDWDDPSAIVDFEECSSETGAFGDGK